MGRDADERPPIEVLGADLGVSSTQHVALGPRRSGPSRKRLFALGAVVVGVLVAGVALGGSDEDPEPAGDEANEPDSTQEEERSTTSDRETTTTASTTTTTAPVGPPLGAPVEGALLIGNGSTWRVVYLSTGDVVEADLPPADPYSSVAIGGGLVVPEVGEARFYPILDRTEGPDFTVLGPADLVLRAGPDRLWLLDTPPEDGAPSPETVARLVTLDGEILRQFDVPGRWFTDATPDAILVSRGGRVFAADQDGLRPFGVGWTQGTIGDAAVVLTCEEDGSCAVVRQPLDGGRARVLVDDVDPDSYFEAIEAPDGRLALSNPDPRDGEGDLVIFSADGDAAGSTTISTSTLVSPPQWLPGDLGLAVHRGQRVDWIRPAGDGWEVVPIELEIGGRFSDEIMFVVAP